MAISDQQRIYAYNIAERLELELPALDEIQKFIEKYAEVFDFWTRFDRITDMYEMSFKKGPESNYFLFINTFPCGGVLKENGFGAVVFLECELNKRSGLYAFESIEGEIVYIGKSNNLAKRIPQSYGEKWSNFDCEGEYINRILYYEESEANIGVLEMYLISKYKPKFNKDGNTDGKTTVFIYDLDIQRDFKELPYTKMELLERSARWREYRKWVKRDISG